MAKRTFYKGTNNKSLRTATMFSLSKRYGWVCWYCGAPVNPESASVDHIVPQCDKGDDHEDNLALACIFCQRAKYTFPAGVFVQWLTFVRSDKSQTFITDRRLL